MDAHILVSGNARIGQICFLRRKKKEHQATIAVASQAGFYCEITICDVLVILAVLWAHANECPVNCGRMRGYAYVTVTFTRLPGALHVPVVQELHATGMLLFELYHVAVAVRLDVLMPGKLKL